MTPKQPCPIVCFIKLRKYFLFLWGVIGVVALVGLHVSLVFIHWTEPKEWLRTNSIHISGHKFASHETIALQHSTFNHKDEEVKSYQGGSNPITTNSGATMTKSRVRDSSFRMPKNAPWRKSKVLPEWMKDYFQWHQDARRNLTADNVNDYDYLVFRCLEDDRKCGGAADRLKPLPFLLLVGSKLKRLVFYRWERPAPLEEYLVPPLDGLDWRWPPHPSLANYEFPPRTDLDKMSIRAMFGLVESTDRWPRHRKLPKIATFYFQSTNHGMTEYNQMRSNNATEFNYMEIFRDCWDSAFIPSPAVQKLIDTRMSQFQLITDQYHAIHVRSQYWKDLDPERKRNLTGNAVNCLYQYLQEIGSPLQATTPVFVASDSPSTSRLTVQYAQRIGLQHVVTRDTIDGNEEEKTTLHLDRGKSFWLKQFRHWTRHEASEY